MIAIESDNRMAKPILLIKKKSGQNCVFNE